MYRIVRQSVLVLMIILVASVTFAAVPEIVAKDPGGCGLLGKLDGKRILIVSGTPEQMGAAHGNLLTAETRITMQRVVYLVGGASTAESESGWPSSF